MGGRTESNRTLDRRFDCVEGQPMRSRSISIGNAVGNAVGNAAGNAAGNAKRLLQLVLGRLLLGDVPGQARDSHGQSLLISEQGGRQRHRDLPAASGLPHPLDVAGSPQCQLRGPKLSL